MMRRLLALSAAQWPTTGATLVIVLRWLHWRRQVAMTSQAQWRRRHLWAQHQWCLSQYLLTHFDISRGTQVPAQRLVAGHLITLALGFVSTFPMLLLVLPAAVDNTSACCAQLRGMCLTKSALCWSSHPRNPSQLYPKRQLSATVCVMRDAWKFTDRRAACTVGCWDNYISFVSLLAEQCLHGYYNCCLWQWFYSIPISISCHLAHDDLLLDVGRDVRPKWTIRNLFLTLLPVVFALFSLFRHGSLWEKKLLLIHISTTLCGLLEYDITTKFVEHVQQRIEQLAQAIF